MKADDFLLPLVLRLPPDAMPMRLDAALGLALPGLGLRARRRLWDWCRVLVNGKKRAPGFMAGPGDEIRVEDGRGRLEDVHHTGKSPGADTTQGRDAPRCAESAAAADTPPYAGGGPDGFLSVDAAPGAGQSPDSFPPAGAAAHTAFAAPATFAVPKGLRLLELTPDFAAFAKPAGLHSAHVAASPETSVEALLPCLWPELYRIWRAECDVHRAPLAGALSHSGSDRVKNPAASSELAADLASGPASGSAWGPASAFGPDEPAPDIPLTRLDKATSGILLVARNEAAAARFRRDEARGLVSKRYLALVRGSLDGPLHLDGQLRTSGGPVCFVSEHKDPDPARHTLVEVLGRAALHDGRPRPAADGPYTLVLARISRGARHQIRAHLAGAGFPIAGDSLYGGASEAASTYVFCPIAASAHPFCEGSVPDEYTFFAKRARFLALGAKSVIWRQPLNEEAAGLFLHHAALDFPGFSTRCPAPWLDWFIPAAFE